MSKDRTWAVARVKSHVPEWATVHLDVERVISMLEKGRYMAVTEWTAYVRCSSHLKAMKKFLQGDGDITFRERYILRRHQPGHPLAARYWVNLDGSLPRFPPKEMLWAIFLRGTTVRYTYFLLASLSSRETVTACLPFEVILDTTKFLDENV